MEGGDKVPVLVNPLKPALSFSNLDYFSFFWVIIFWASIAYLKAIECDFWSITGAKVDFSSLNLNLACSRAY